MIVDWCQRRAAGAVAVAPAGEPGSDDAAGDPVRSARRWHVLQTRPRQEKTVAGLLDGTSAAPFLPVITRVMHYGHRRRTVEIPLFSGYLFVHGSLEETYAAIGSRRSVRPLRVNDERRLSHELLQIRRAMAGEAEFSPYRYLERGMRVRVSSGPLKDVEGVVDTGERHNRLVLVIQTLGRATSIEVDACLLVRMDE